MARQMPFMAPQVPMNTRYQQLKEIADHTGLTEILDRVGLAQVLGKSVRFCLDREERDRHREIKQDYSSSRQVFQQLNEDVPEGSPSAPVWLIGSMNTVWGVKLESILGLAMRLKGFRPVAVCPDSWEWRAKYHAICGVLESLHFRTFLRLTPEDHSEPWWPFPGGRPCMRDLMRLTYHDVDIGRIAVSNLMYRKKFSKFDLSDDTTVAELRTGAAMCAASSSSRREDGPRIQASHGIDSRKRSLALLRKFLEHASPTVSLLCNMWAHRRSMAISSSGIL